LDPGGCHHRGDHGMIRTNGYELAPSKTMATAVEDTSLQRNALMGYVRPHPFAEMRESGIRGLLVCCADYRCNHSIAISGDH
jgi:hypothetical protein